MVWCGKREGLPQFKLEDAAWVQDSDCRLTRRLNNT